MAKRSEQERTRSMGTRGLILSAVITVGITACQSGHRNVVDGGNRDVKGKVESTVGGVTGDARMQSDGQLDQDKGKTQKAVGKVQEKIDVNVQNP